VDHSFFSVALHYTTGNGTYRYDNFRCIHDKVIIFIRSMKPFLSPSAVKLRSELSAQENIDDDSITEAIRYSASNPSMTSANSLQNELVVRVFVEFVTV